MVEQDNIIYVTRRDKLEVNIANDKDYLGKTAANSVVSEIKELLELQDSIRIVFAAAPSQDQFLEELCKSKVEWNRIDAFHMDEYIGLTKDAPQLFGKYLDDHLFSKVNFRTVKKINSQAEDIEKECLRYAQLLSKKQIDIVCMGIGENGHIAFNDPAVADFNDNKVVKIVELDEACRMQQVNDGCFTSIDDVPVKAISLTIPTLMSAQHLSIVVPGVRKSEAVKNSLYGKVDESCPASILRTHPSAILFLDTDSASKIDY